MHVRIRLKAFFLVLVLAVPVFGATPEKPSIMPLSEIRPGMRGIGKTVVSGQTPEEFQFEVMDILQSGGGPITSDKLIMFRMYGPLVEKAGGSAAGMGGRPPSINRRAVGGPPAALA